MKKTDYESVAARFDDNAVRHRIEADPFLGELIASRGPARLDALDLACGTGNYLAVQQRAYPTVRWCGVDASAAMLARARQKVTAGTPITEGFADAVPHADASFDFVSINFAFHHFPDKPRALDEIVRITRPGARVRLRNVDPPRMRRWWVYRLMPEAWLEDEKRFWSSELLAYELEVRGFTVRVQCVYEAQSIPLAEVLADAERRDISQLANATEAQYQRLLSEVRRTHEQEPGGSIATEIALLDIRAERC